jgi:hypothetical protein
VTAFDRKLEAATRAVTTEYHLAYYEGEGRELHRVGGPQKPK